MYVIEITHFSLAGLSARFTIPSRNYPTDLTTRREKVSD